MAMFSVNQVRQFYVVRKCLDAGTVTNFNDVAKTGDILIRQTADGEEVFFTHKGKLGATRTDLIQTKNLMWAHATSARKLRRKINNSVITFHNRFDAGNCIGKDLIIKLLFDNYTFPSEESIYVKYGCAHIVRGMNASDLYKQLAVSLAGNIARDEVKPVNVYVVAGATYIPVTGSKVADNKALEGKTATGIAVIENPQPWYLGTMEQISVRWNVEAIPVTDQDGEEISWVTEETIQQLTDTDLKNVPGYENQPYIKNGKKVADMEYFYHGERGDMYRGVEWPKGIRTTYEVDSHGNDVEAEYDLIDIHYAFTDSHEGVQKSERTLTIAVLNDNADAGMATATTSILTALNDLNVKVKEVDIV